MQEKYTNKKQDCATFKLESPNSPSEKRYCTSALNQM